MGWTLLSPFPPNVDALPDLLPPVKPHLLAAVSFATGQYPNRLDIKTSLFREIRKDEIYWDMRSLVSNIVVHHYEWRAFLKHFCPGEDQQ
jgi:hypothetical protein